MKNDNFTDMILDLISQPLAKAIEAIMALGADKDQALEVVTLMVEYIYASPDVREQMFNEIKEKTNG